MNAISPVRLSGNQISTAEQRLVAMAESLTQPVADRLLPIQQASASLLCASLRAARAGKIEADPVEFASILQHILRLNVENVAVQRMITTGAIRRKIKPFIGIRATADRIVNVAYDENARAGCPLPKSEVDEIISLAMYAAMHPMEGWQ